MLFYEHEIGMTYEELCDLVLVFPPLKGAGGIHERAAAREHLRGAVEDFALTHDAPLHVLYAPLGDRRLVPAEHSLARTGGVDENFVKVLREPRGERGRIGAHDGGVPHAQALDVLRQDARAVKDVLVRDEHAFSAHRRGELGGLAPGRGAQIEHPFPRFYSQQGRGTHGGRLLRVEEPRVPCGGMSHLFRRRVKAALRPGNALSGEGRKRNKCLGGELEKVGAHAANGRGVITTQKGGVRRAQPFLHSDDKFFGKVHDCNSALSRCSSGTNAAPAEIAF